MTKLESLKKDFLRSQSRFEEILKKKKTIIIRDSALKRFEFTFDLAWKLLRAALEEQKGVSCASPKDCVREAFRQGLIEYNEVWIKMPDWRNKTVHEYSEAYADKIYAKLPGVLKAFQKLTKALKKI